MNTPPEAKTEYSRGPRGSRGGQARRSGPAGRGFRRLGLTRPEGALLAGGLLGAALLIMAEFVTLYELHVSTSIAPVSSTTTGAHNSYALVPIGLLAAALTVAAVRGTARGPALLALAGLGIVSLLIALLGDLPDAHAHGITSNLKFATTSAGEGLYLETLGGILLLLTGGIGLVALAPPLSLRRRRPPAQPRPPRVRSEL